MKYVILYLASTLFFLSCAKEEEQFPVTKDFEGAFVFIGPNDSGKMAGEVITLDSTGLNQLTFKDTFGFHNSDPVWVKNGEYIHYRYYTGIGPSFGRNIILKADGSSPRDFFMSAISPNSKYGAKAGGALIVYSLDENFNTIKIDSLGDQIIYQQVSWSPDSESILYTTWNASRYTLSIYNINTHSNIDLFSYDEGDGIIGGVYSYYGDKIAFIWKEDIYIINADGTGLYNLTSSQNREYDIAWSPSDDVLAYYCMSPDGKRDIILHDFTSGSAHKLTGDKTANELINHLQWSADGKDIAFTSSGEHPGIYIIDQNGIVLKRIYDRYVSDLDWNTR